MEIDGGADAEQDMKSFPSHFSRASYNRNIASDRILDSVHITMINYSPRNCSISSAASWALLQGSNRLLLIRFDWGTDAEQDMKGYHLKNSTNYHHSPLSLLDSLNGIGESWGYSRDGMWYCRGCRLCESRVLTNCLMLWSYWRSSECFDQGLEGCWCKWLWDWSYSSFLLVDLTGHESSSTFRTKLEYSDLPLMGPV